MTRGLSIGFTYDLRSEYLAMGYSELETAEFDQDSTIDALRDALRGLGHDVTRIGHAKKLAAALVEGRRWDLVFNICEGLHGFSRESQVPSLLDLYEIPYTFSSPLVTDLCLHKAICKQVVGRAGVPVTPDWLIESADVDTSTLGVTYPAFVKPVAEGTGKGIAPDSVVRDPAQLQAKALALLETFNQPALVEPYLTGREFTVGIVGTGDQAVALGTLEIILRDGAEPEIHSYINKERCEDLVEYRFVDRADDAEVAAAEAAALKAWRVLGCRDAGRIDLRSDGSGSPMFLEANPLAGLHPTHSDLPMLATAVDWPYARLIEAIVESARVRTSPRPSPSGA